MTPHTKGTQVTGLVNWSRIFQMLVSAAAPLTPSNCRTPELPSSASLFLAESEVDVEAIVVAADTPLDSEISKGKKEEPFSKLLGGVGVVVVDVQCRLVRVDCLFGIKAKEDWNRRGTDEAATFC